MELQKRIPIAGAKIKNLNSGAIATTDTAGNFLIQADKGHLLSIKSLGFMSDTLFIADLRFCEILLLPDAKQLKEVVVQNTVIDSTITWLHPEFHGQRVKYQRDENGFYKGGILISLYHNKDSRKERARLKRLKRAELFAEIDRLFSASSVSKYIPLKEMELHDFISLFRPSIETFKSGNFHFLIYLNDCYQKWLKLPPEKRRLPPLPEFSPN